VVTSPSPEKENGEIWRIVFEKKGIFGQKFEKLFHFGDFSPKKRIASSVRINFDTWIF
jgi:hypothetical protein